MESIFRLPTEPAQRKSLAALVIANMIPLVGVLALDWDLYGVMVLYWAENSILGLFNVLKMLRIGGQKAVPLTAFFCVHYGFFMFVHFVFVKRMFGPDTWGLFPSLDDIVEALAPVASGLLSTLVSHAISYRVNFLGRREYERTDLDAQMTAPYQRMALLHVTLIAGGWIIMSQGQPIGALVVFVLLKTAVDAWAHLRERAGKTTAR
jgi:hypothetical protein